MANEKVKKEAMKKIFKLQNNITKKWSNEGVTELKWAQEMTMFLFNILGIELELESEIIARTKTGTKKEKYNYTKLASFLKINIK